jgi:rod shape determining protein RodA
MVIGSTTPHGATLRQKLWQIRWLLIVLLSVITGTGVAMLYSAAGGSFEPWAWRHLVRFTICLGILVAVAVTDIRLWLRYAYVIYAVSLSLLVAVEIEGYIGMGAQRWIDLGVINLQPSELMKIALILSLARYFHGCTAEDVGRPLKLIVPLLMVATPAALVLRQPDLGTAMMIVISAGAVFFLAGVHLWMFLLVAFGAAAAGPVAWQFLHDYQRRRVLTFLDPEADPLGSGYHIIQSKIALGSGGLWGKGFMNGSQSHLNFLPEKQTDFIFTMLAEEMGLVVATALILAYVMVIGYGIAIALSSRSQFGRLLAMGVVTTFFLYVFINMAMVMGLIPVVGVPLPLLSYGGTAMLSLMFGLGLVMSTYVHRDLMIGRHSTGADG